MKMTDLEMLKKKPYNLIIEIIKENPDKRIRLKHLKFAVCDENKNKSFRKQKKYLDFFGYDKINYPSHIKDKEELQKYVINLFWLGKKHRTLTGNRQYLNLVNCLRRLVEERHILNKFNDTSHSPYFTLTNYGKYCFECVRFEKNSEDILGFKDKDPEKIKPVHIDYLKDVNDGIEKNLF